MFCPPATQLRPCERTLAAVTIKTDGLIFIFFKEENACLDLLKFHIRGGHILKIIRCAFLVNLKKGIINKRKLKVKTN